MKILVVGRGGREHALAWKLARSTDVDEVLAAPGNPGMAQVARLFPVSPTDAEGLLRICREEGVGLVVFGPETPLIEGVSDTIRAAGFDVFGPGASGARLEGSKVFSKTFFHKYNIPTARFGTFDDPGAAEAAARAWEGPVVVKADGEAAGKGVLICGTPDEAVEAVRTVMRDHAFGAAGDRVVLEDRLEGIEMSLFALCDGDTVLPFQTAQDYKRAYDGDAGPNTGGMGAVTPVPFVTPEMYARAVAEVLEPTAAALRAEGIPYRGLLYAGLMWCADGWKLLEYNARFGDPETQPLLVHMKSDLFPLLLATARGELSGHCIAWNDGVAACVTLASAGYPETAEKGRIITGIKLAEELEGVTVFHAGTARNDQGLLVTGGGRVLNVVATGADAETALARAYEAAALIDFTGKWYRRDIGKNLLIPR
jgi:phosphoribosylamine--glycine ligase